jgi:DNA-binding NtrC family response regulator
MIGDDGPQVTRLREPDFLQELARHAWPGNVRELRNFLERCVALGETLSPSAGPGPAAPTAAAVAEAVDLSLPLKQARDRHQRAFEERYVRALMEAHGGNITAAARAAGVDRITLYRLLWRFGMR